MKRDKPSKLKGRENQSNLESNYSCEINLQEEKHNILESVNPQEKHKYLTIVLE